MAVILTSSGKARNNVERTHRSGSGTSIKYRPGGWFSVLRG